MGTSEGTPGPRIVADRYELGRTIGRGAMATVYAAYDRLGERPVALKLLHPHLAVEAVRLRLAREVSLAAKIQHPGVVQIFGSGVDPADGAFYIAMELLEGETLYDRLHRGGLGPDTALALVLELLEPLAAAHAYGVVHRDLKPANVFLARLEDGSERVTLLDFGIARDLEGSSITRTESALGTPQYMAPEQAMDAKRATPAADVWAIGVLIYFVLARVHPFEGESPYDVVVRACTTPHVRLSRRVDGLDPRLEALVDRCLSKDPSARPADADQLRAELAPLLARADVERSLAALRLRPLEDANAPAAPEAADARDRGPKTELDLPPRRARAGVWLGLGVLAIASASVWWATRPPAPSGAPTQLAAPTPLRAATATTGAPREAMATTPSASATTADARLAGPAPTEAAPSEAALEAATAPARTGDAALPNTAREGARRGGATEARSTERRATLVSEPRSPREAGRVDAKAERTASGEPTGDGRETKPTAAEPARTEATRTEPAPSEPARTEPAPVEPTRTEPTRTEPTRPEPKPDAGVGGEVAPIERPPASKPLPPKKKPKPFITF